MKVEINPQKIYASIIAYMLSFVPLISLINSITNELFGNMSIDSYIIIFVLFGMMGIGLYPLLVEKFHGDCLIVFTFFLLSYLITICWFPQNIKYLFTDMIDFLGNPIYSLFVLSLPGYLFARYLKDYSLFCFIMRKYAYVVVSLSVIVFFFLRDSFATQYLTFSYSMLLHLLFLIFFKPPKRKLLHNIITVLGVFVFVFGGARGALISFCICCVFHFFIANKQKIKNITAIIITSFLGCGFLIMKNEIMSLLLLLLTKMNIHSRTLEYILTAELMNSSGRDKIAQDVMSSINVLGHGLMGDRVVASGVYAHNLFLEIICDFGIIVGLILSVTIIVIIGVGLFKMIRNNQSWIILLLSTGFFKLMLSGSFLDTEPAFYILMGLCVNSFMENRRNDKVIEESIYDDEISS